MIYLVHDLVELRNDKDLRSQPRKTAAVIIVAILILIGGIVYSIISAPKDNSASLKSEYQAALDEASSLPEGQGKIVLTQRLLKATYAKVCSTEAKFGVFDLILLSFFFSASILFFGLVAVKIHGIHQRGASIEPGDWVIIIFGSFLIIVILSLIIIIPPLYKHPEQENSHYWVDALQITRKEKKEEYFNGKHTSYYIYYDFGGQEIRRKVMQSTYSAITEPGIYYFAYSSDDSTQDCFAIYPDTEYTKEADPSESAS